MATAIGLAQSVAVQPALAVQLCSAVNQCAQVGVDSATGLPGSTVSVGIHFTQGPDDGHAGGIDEIAALALTLSMDDGGVGAPPLTLANCNMNPNGLPQAINPNASISNFNLVVQNARCVNGRTHCLCPDAGSGITPDRFINIALFGPNLQTASPPLTIPLLPDGQLFTVDLAIAANASGTIPLHVLNAAADIQRPQSTAFISIGDSSQIDQTCVPVAGQRPCSAANAVSQVASLDGNIVVTSISTATPTNTLVPTVTRTRTPSGTPTRTATSLPTPTATEVPTATPIPTATSSSTPTGTGSPSPTHTTAPTDTPTSTPIATPTESPAPTATGTGEPTVTPTTPCVGDCSTDRIVTVDEVLTMVNIALGSDSVTKCPAGDGNGDQQITVDEILTAVSHALNGCQSS